MTESERVEDWVRHYSVCLLKMNALQAVLANDGERVLQEVLKRLKLQSALDVVKACDLD